MLRVNINGEERDILPDPQLPSDRLRQLIAIQLSEGTYCKGDYWLIPARTTTREIEWPPYHRPNTMPIPQPRFGVRHHYSRLARVRLFQGQGQRYERSIHDCRRRFTALPPAVDAMHVKLINWDNDSLHSRKLLQWKEPETHHAPEGEGLKIWLDWEPHPASIKAETLIVTLETNLLGGGEGSFILHGHIAVQRNLITWHWLKREKEGFLAELFEKDDQWFRRFFDKPERYVRIRVTLKGHAIWRSFDNRLIHLDGQAFAIPGTEPHHGGPRTALYFPSGGNMRASDFESWFYIREEKLFQ
ncbi:MAG: hypothetical protein NVSMB49_19080 [Ktedonobacteraceae bacterium]